MSKPQASFDDLQKAKDARQVLMGVRYDPNTDPELIPFLETSLNQADIAINLYESQVTQGKDPSIDLSQFLDPMSMARGGFEREERRRQVVGLEAELESIKDNIRDIDAQLATDVITPEAQATLIEQKRSLQEIANNITRGQQRQTSLRFPVTAPYAAKLERTSGVTNALIRDAGNNAYQQYLLANPNDVEGAERARRETVDFAYSRQVLQGGGDPSILNALGLPIGENVDFATGMKITPEGTEEMGALESFTRALGPQVTARRGEVTPAPTEITPATEAQRIAEGSLQKLMQQPRKIQGVDVMVETPAAFVIRLMNFVPSAATGAITQGLTYPTDAEGNPTNTDDITFLVEDFITNGKPLTMNGLPILGVDVETNPRAKIWADASTTYNGMVGAVSRGLGFYEVSTNIPAINQEDTTSGYLVSKMAGLGALATDFVMPLDPFGYVTKPVKGARGLLRAARNIDLPKPKLTLQELKNSETIYRFDDGNFTLDFVDEPQYRFTLDVDSVPILGDKSTDAWITTNINLDSIDKALTQASNIQAFALPETLVNYVSARAYKYEMNRLIDDAFDSRTSIGSIGGTRINNVQDVASNEVAQNLADLVILRTYDNLPENIGTPWARNLIKENGYKEFSDLSRLDPDNPFRMPIILSDSIVDDLRLLRNAKRTGQMPRGLMYNAVFRNNLVRAAAKSNDPLIRGPVLQAYKTSDFTNVSDDFFVRIAENPDIVNEAAYRTIRAQIKEQLNNRLPIDLMYVAGGTRTISSTLNTNINQAKVSLLVRRVNDPKISGRSIMLGENTDEQLEMLIDGLGVENIRQSPYLKSLVDKVQNRMLLNETEYNTYQNAVEAAAWQTIAEEAVGTPVLTTRRAYDAAIDMRSNDVFLARQRAESAKYLASQTPKVTKLFSRFKQTYDKLKLRVVGSTTEPLSGAKVDELFDRAGLSYFAKGDGSLELSPKPYLDMQNNINALKSTEYDAFINRLEVLRRQNNGDGALALEQALGEAVEIHIRAQQNIVTNRVSDLTQRYMASGLSKTVSTNKAIEFVNERINANIEYVNKMVGEKIPPPLNVSIREQIRKQTRYDLISTFYDKFFTFKDFEATAALPKIFDKYAASTEPITPLMFGKLNEEIASSGIGSKLAGKQISKRRFGFFGDNIVAFTEANLIFTLYVRSNVRVNQQINKILTEYPSMIQDLVNTPTRLLNNNTKPVRLVAKAKEQAASITEGQIQRFFDGDLEGLPRDITKLKGPIDDALFNLTRAALFIQPDELSGLGNSIIEGMVQHAIGNTKTTRRSFLNSIAKSDSGVGQAYTALSKQLDKLFVGSTDNTKNQVLALLTANTTGMNAGYTGNLADLSAVKSGALLNENIATTPLQILELEINQILKNYGMFKGNEVYRDKYYQQYLEQVIRPRLEFIDNQALGLFYGRELAQEIGKKPFEQIKAAQQFRQTMDFYRKQDGFDIGQQVFGTLGRVQMTGILGGMLPNSRYALQNVLTVPLLMITSLRNKEVFTALTKYTYRDIQLSLGRVSPDDVFIRTATGRSITVAEYKGLLSEHEIATTFSASQFSATSLSEMIRALRVDSALVESVDGVLKYKGNVGYAATLGRYIDPTKRTFGTMLTHYSDMLFRRAVFAQGLEQGLTPVQAATKSRAALYDYGASRNSPSAKAAGNVVAFWSFQQQSFVAMLRSLLSTRSNAQRLLRVQQIYNDNQESVYVGDNREASRLWRFVTEKGRYRKQYVAGPLNPIYDSFALLCDSFALMGALAVNAAKGDERMQQAVLQLAKDKLGRFPLLPLYASFLQQRDIEAGFGKRNKFDSGNKRLPRAYYPLLDPPNFGMTDDNAFITEFNLQRVDPIQGYPSYKGGSYVFTGNGYEYFERFRFAMEMTGLQRFVEDTLKTYQISGVITDAEYERGYYSAVNQWQGYTNGSLLWMQIEGAVLYQTTIMTPLESDTPESGFIYADETRKQQLEAIKPIIK